ncbi:hypothetical protein ACFYKT_17945 [Cytobacillus sp. FJAT-53684]|uniref:Secreted protein n=1 Tax=Cytobacillus mangrovibacter TaxID=3299024 RepID=A0ABW6K668_9BACI
MPLWIVLVGISSVFFGMGVCVDYFNKKNGRTINTKMLREKTKDNLGCRSAFTFKRSFYIKLKKPTHLFPYLIHK